MITGRRNRKRSVFGIALSIDISTAIEQKLPHLESSRLAYRDARCSGVP